MSQLQSSPDPAIEPDPSRPSRGEAWYSRRNVASVAPTVLAAVGYGLRARAPGVGPVEHLMFAAVKGFAVQVVCTLLYVFANSAACLILDEESDIGPDTMTSTPGLAALLLAVGLWVWS